MGPQELSGRDIHTGEGAAGAPWAAMVGAGPGFSFHLLHTSSKSRAVGPLAGQLLGLHCQVHPGSPWGQEELLEASGLSWPLLSLSHWVLEASITVSPRLVG